MIDSWLLLLQDLHQRLVYESYCLRRQPRIAYVSLCSRSVGRVVSQNDALSDR